MQSIGQRDTRISQLNAIGIALSAEKDLDRLLELILSSAMGITNADGGSLYMLLPANEQLKLVIMRNNSLGLRMGGTTGKEIPFEPIPLYKADHSPHMDMIVTCAVLRDETIKIADAYTAEEFDFSGTREFDAKTGYRSRSFLAVPLKNEKNRIIGVLQLINALAPATGAVTTFSDEDQQLVESLASQAAIAITNNNLIAELKDLLDSFVRLIATAIDEKSPYTGMHCKRVPVISGLLADAATKSKHGALRDFSLDPDQRYELEMASWLHDCGKITTPEYIIDKHTKLETICDRIELVDTRFEIIKRDLQIEKLERLQAARAAGDNPTGVAGIEADYAKKIEALEQGREFIRACNRGAEFMSDAAKQRIAELAAYGWTDHAGEARGLLTEDEIYNLQIEKGTLTAEERDTINAHVSATLKLLNSLPFPDYLRNVPEFAGSHHERVDGRGYTRGLNGEQMSIQAKIIAVADVFEALTDCNRPYRQGMKLSKALAIMGRMVAEGHIDPDLFHVFVEEKLYLTYAKNFLKPEQIDPVDHAMILGGVQ